MSRTDKDRPYWVKLQDPTTCRVPHHAHENDGRRWRRRDDNPSCCAEDSCELNTVARSRAEHEKKDCYYEFGGAETTLLFRCDCPWCEYSKHTYNADQERRHTHAALLAARKQYNAGCDLEEEGYFFPRLR